MVDEVWENFSLWENFAIGGFWEVCLGGSVGWGEAPKGIRFNHLNPTSSRHHIQPPTIRWSWSKKSTLQTWNELQNKRLNYVVCLATFKISLNGQSAYHFRALEIKSNVSIHSGRSSDISQWQWTRVSIAKIASNSLKSELTSTLNWLTNNARISNDPALLQWPQRTLTHNSIMMKTNQKIGAKFSLKCVAAIDKRN